MKFFIHFLIYFQLITIIKNSFHNFKIDFFYLTFQNEKNLNEVKNRINIIQERFYSILLINETKTEIIKFPNSKKICKQLIKEYNKSQSDLKIYLNYNNKINTSIQYQICGWDKKTFRPLLGIISISKKFFKSKNKDTILMNGIFHILGFDKTVLKKKKIKNNYYNNTFLKNEYLYPIFIKLFDLFSFNVNIKYYSPYLDQWYNFPFDLMNDNNPTIYSTLTELTMNLLENLGWYKFIRCDLIYYKKMCFHINKQCIFRNKIGYILFYEFDNKNKPFCYYNEEKQIFEKKCSNKIGNLIKNEYLDFTPNYYINQDNLNVFDLTEQFEIYGQHLNLLTVSNTICPKKHERTIFIYYHPPILGDQKEYNKTVFENKNFKIEHEIIKDSKYFFNYTNAIPSLVTYNIPFSKNNLTLVNSYYYSTESFACSYIYRNKDNYIKIHTNKYPT